MACKSCEEARKAVKRKLKYIAGKLSWSRKTRSHADRSDSTQIISDSRYSQNK